MGAAPTACAGQLPKTIAKGTSEPAAAREEERAEAWDGREDEGNPRAQQHPDSPRCQFGIRA